MQSKPAVKITKKPGMAVQTEVKAGYPGPDGIQKMDAAREKAKLCGYR